MEEGTLKQCWYAQNGFNYPIETKILGGAETVVTFAEAEDPVATLHFVKGFKSDPKHYKDFLDDMVSKNINVVLVTLPDPLEEIDFYEEYEYIAEAVYLGGELDYLTDPNLPLIAGNHSTGGFLLTKLLTSPLLAQEFSERYDANALIAPFYGSRYHSDNYIGPLAKLYSKIFGNKLVGTTWLERQFYKAAANDNQEEDKMLANHRQALYMMGPTQKLMKEIRKNGLPESLHDMQTKFFLSLDDQVSHNLLSAEVAAEMQADIVPLDGTHSHVRETAHGRSIFADFILDVVDQINLEKCWENKPIQFKSSRCASAPDPSPT